MRWVVDELGRYEPRRPVTTSHSTPRPPITRSTVNTHCRWVSD